MYQKHCLYNSQVECVYCNLYFSSRITLVNVFPVQKSKCDFVRQVTSFSFHYIFTVSNHVLGGVMTQDRYIDICKIVPLV